MLDFRPLIHPSFWFNLQPVALTSGSQRLLFIVFAFCLVMGAIIRMVAGHHNQDRHVTEAFNRLGRLGVVMGIFGLVIFFCSFQEIALFGARFWYLLWVGGFVFWLGSIVRYVVKIVPAERAEALAEAEKRKYLPGTAR